MKTRNDPGSLTRRRKVALKNRETNIKNYNTLLVKPFESDELKSETERKLALAESEVLILKKLVGGTIL